MHLSERREFERPQFTAGGEPSASEGRGCHVNMLGGEVMVKGFGSGGEVVARVSCGW